MRRSIALLLLLSATSLSQAGAAPAAPVVHVQQGDVAGTDLGRVDAFLGLPFAQPPVGPGRWRAPTPPAAWDDVREASAPGPDCVQDTKDNKLTAGYSNRESEDCLYLNVWRPHGARGARLPVMVWIHGGAFIMGSGSLPEYDGAVLARHGAVIVTINYRLGRFGTYANPALSREQAGQPVADYGLMDQIAALRWVRRNAASFGGDPGNVTIFGESAGASSVNFLLTSPAARGLFERAISESGGSSENIQPLADAERAGLAWARAKGVPDNDVAALRALPAATVLDAPVRAPVFPVRDGRIVLADTTVAFARGDAARVPYLLGANDDEQSLLRWLPGADQALLRRLGPAGGPLLTDYGDAGAQALDVMWGDAAMVEPTRRRALADAEHGVPAWLYRFAYVPERLRGKVAGVGHSDEIRMVFGHAATPAAQAAWTAQDRKMADLVGAYWVAFARNGVPAAEGGPAWPRFTPAAETLLLFGNDGPVPVAHFEQKRLDALERAETR